MHLPRRRGVLTAELRQARPSPAEAPKAKGGRDRGQKMLEVDKISTVTKEDPDGRRATRTINAPSG